LPAFDLHAPLLSLPGILRTRLETIPASVPYLRAKPELVEYWRGILSAIPGYRVGIAWQGNPEYPGDRLRSIPLAEFAPLAAVAGASLISLQKQHGLEQLPAALERFRVVQLAEVDEQAGAFMDTAAIMMNLDLVVVPDLALAHLAGALGVPVWVALPFASDWRWLLARDDSLWYPTMRLFRQPRAGDWAGVMVRLRAELDGLDRNVAHANPKR
jgi:hypothetical protein